MKAIKQYLLLFITVFTFSGVVHAIDLSGLDLDGSIGNGEHKYVPAVSNPLFNETPYITTEARPIYVRHSASPQASTLFGADINVVAVQLRLALTDNLGIIATKDGYTWIDWDGTTNSNGVKDTEGFNNLAFGLKYAFHNNVENQSIATAGIKYEPPSGSIHIDTALAHPLDNVDLSGAGDGFVNFFLTGAKRYKKLGLQASGGVNVAIDGDHDSSLIHYTLHADYEVHENVFPMISLNGFTVYDEANRPGLTNNLVSGFEVTDLANIGCSIDCGTVLTAAGGIRFRAMDNILLGIGAEKSIGREDLFDWRGYFDMVIHF